MSYLSLNLLFSIPQRSVILLVSHSDKICHILCSKDSLGAINRFIKDNIGVIENIETYNVEVVEYVDNASAAWHHIHKYEALGYKVHRPRKLPKWSTRVGIRIIGGKPLAVVFLVSLGHKYVVSGLFDTLEEAHDWCAKTYADGTIVHMACALNDATRRYFESKDL